MHPLFISITLHSQPSFVIILAHIYTVILRLAFLDHPIYDTELYSSVNKKLTYT